jgi:endonuclease YncB( thermonuclease family)
MTELALLRRLVPGPMAVFLALLRPLSRSWGARAAIVSLGLVLGASHAAAQPSCVVGIPCGNTCIAAHLTCRVDQPDTTAAADDPTARAEPLRSPLGTRPCTVHRIIDGDTLVCRGGERVRLLLIDAPERNQRPYGRASTAALTRLAPVGSELKMELDVRERDRYRRLLAYLWTADGRMINEELARQGYAVVAVYPPNVRHVERIRAAVEEAREAGSGLWSGSAFDCAPAQHRAGRCER